jgi:hypothetical protein
LAFSRGTGKLLAPGDDAYVVVEGSKKSGWSRPEVSGSRKAVIGRRSGSCNFER